MVIDETSVIILGAGKGTRLNEGQPSEIPKIMHKICSRPMLEYTLDTLNSAGFKDVIVVIGYKYEMVQEHFGNNYKYAIQKEQKGTGHAVMCAEQKVDPSSKNVLVIQGDDSAFYRPQTLIDLVEKHAKDRAKVSILTLDHPSPKELGRIIRNKDGQVIAIKEKEVLTEEEKKISEINTATYCFEAGWLWKNIKELKPSATGQGELILPDLVKIAVDNGQRICAHMITDLDEWVGVNTQHQLDIANEIMAKRLANR
ncbi:NTP transferase domain-containing protein [Patescibacteria group bacterium]|nr:NTP transferase domain-containing protein [Patescibacteria group bacterium]